ncbi:hypothetical protein PRIEUP_LOCUS5676 [Pristimantis euphronides]
MGPKRRSSETDEQIIRQGCVTKSPPSYIFSKKASWKGRLLKLCRTGLSAFTLRYYAYDGVSEEWKGDIHMSDIKSIEVGSQTMERIPTINRLFNNSPNNVLCIKTDKRDYYLLDDSADQITEWHKCITDAWVKVHQRTTEEVLRPRSYPEDYPHTGTAFVEESWRQRSHTDPESLERSPPTLHDYTESIYESATEEKDVTSEQQDSDMLVTHSQVLLDKSHQLHEVRRQSAAALLQANPESHRLSDDLTDPAYHSEPESIYDTPRSVPVKMLDATEQEATSDLDVEEGGVYEKMLSLVIDEVTDLPPEPPQTPPAPPLHRSSDTQRSQLKKAQILRMLYEPHGESDLVSIKLTVETEHLQRYLALQEIGERLCVSRWKGPLHIGCLFHHGDEIESINGFRPGSKDLFFQMLGNSISNEVNLVLTRNKKAAVFHLEGCSCGGS